MRQRAEKNKLSYEQIERLNQLGFSWDPLAEAWETKFAALERFKQREGHVRPVSTHKEAGLNLAQWVIAQRANKGKLSPERIARLDKLGFSWDPLAEDWETHYAALEKFRQREGNVRPKQGHQEDGLNLGWWVVTQRRRKNKLLPDRIARLDQLGFVWKK